MRHKLLLVSSDRTLELLLRNVLTSQYQMDVEAADDQNKLHELLDQERYDLAIIDSHFPRMSGLTALSIAKRRQRRLPTIFLTDGDSASIIDLARQGGAELIIEKAAVVDQAVFAPNFDTFYTQNVAA